MRSLVSIRKTAGDDLEGIREAVRRAADDLGGLEDIIRPGARVLIKPNMVAVPEARLSGAVTRWEVCLAAAELAQEYGGVPVVAESSSVGADTRDVILFCGYDHIREAGIPVVDLKTEGGREYRLSENITTWELVTQADVIITVPVMKTHDQCEITLGMKNMKGVMPDSSKKMFHRRGLIERVIELNRIIKPSLELADGTYCAEGMGPVFGDTKKKDLIIMSKDIVACESVCGMIMGFRPDEVPVTAAAAEAGLGTDDLSEIDVAGEKTEDVAERFVRSHETSIEGLPGSFRMIADESACTGCRNSVMSSLTDMQREGLLGHTEGLTVVAGNAAGAPGRPDPENTVCVGACAAEYAQRNGLRIAEGCPPRNNTVVKTMLRGRAEYDYE
ncbi:MAG: DUF362 domain-containing protein [Anaerovoracaceae bacterium]|nr:DUF362 domain-containing protein [Anaerovoracaceae bacterium]